MQVAALAQGLHLFDEAVFEHRVEALRDALVQPGAIGRLQRDEGCMRQHLLLAVERRHRLAAHAVDLERARDALLVCGLQARGGDRVDPLQLAVERMQAFALQLLVERGTHAAVGGGHGVEPFEQRFVVQHRAAHEQRQLAACADLGDEALRVKHEARGRVGLGWVDDVDEVVRRAGQLVGAGLGGADVHAAVDERRVDAHDLDRQHVGDGQRRGGLARSGGAGEAEVVVFAHVAVAEEAR